MYIVTELELLSRLTRIKSWFAEFIDDVVDCRQTELTVYIFLRLYL